MGGNQGKENNTSVSGGPVYPGYVKLGREGIPKIGWAKMDGSKPEYVECAADELKKIAEQYTDKQVLVCIHGYNVASDGALQMAVDMKKGLGFNGPVLCVDWISQANLSGYSADEVTAEAVVSHMKEVLRVLETLPGPVHFLAHSMGNRILLRAFHEFLLGNPAMESVFGEVFLVAPDVNCEVLKQQIDSATTLSGRQSPEAQYPSSVTLYTSEKDLALKLSQMKHKDGRAGKGRGPLGSIDQIKCEEVARDALGHSYYCEPDVLLDIEKKIRTGAPARNRDNLKPLRDEGDNVFRLYRRSKDQCMLM